MKPLVGTLVILTVVFQHFQLGVIGGFPVTLGALAGIVLAVILTAKVNAIVLTLVLSVLVGVTALAALANNTISQAGYLSTLALFVLACVIISMAFGSIRWHLVNSRSFKNSLLVSLLVVVLVAVGQVALGSVGNSALFNPFGEHQYLRLYDPHLGAVQFPRAHSFFLEPSYAAFVVGTLAVALICLNVRVTAVTVLSVAGMVACQSVTGLLILIVILLIVASKSRALVRIVVSLGLLAVVFFSWDYLTVRIATIGTEGSSAYYRIIAPSEVIVDTLTHNPLGMTLGSVASVVSSYGFNMAGVLASSLDNGFYVVVYYFGWLGIVILLAGALTALGSSIRRSKASLGYSWIAPIWLISTLFFSGGIMAPEFALMAFIVIVAFRLNPLTRELDEHPTSAERDSRDVSRPRGVTQDA